MKKQVLFSLCLTASAVVMVSGCATKQSAKQAAAEQEAIEIAQQEEQLIQDDVNAEAVQPTITPTETTPEVAPAPAPAPVAEEQPRQVIRKPTIPQHEVYTVTAGDSISALSARFNVRKADILALNPELRDNPNALRIGSKVKFPAGTKVDTPAKPRVKKATPKGANTYTVKAGDVLGGIANRHGVTVAAIKSANGMKSDTIIVGQKLIIPAGGKVVKKSTPKKTTPKKAEAKKTEPKKTEAKKTEPKKEAPKQEEVKPAEPPAPVVEEVPAPIAEGEEAPVLDATPPPPPPVEAPVVDVPATPAQETRAYVVAPGEDLVSVSLKWGVPLPTLRAINNLDEAQGNAIAPGTTLQIPVTQE